MYFVKAMHLLVLTVIAYLLLCAAPVRGGGDFTKTCNNIEITWEWDLVADCKRTDGNYQRATLGLKYCLMNDDGNLRWAPFGMFQQSCKSPRYWYQDNGSWYFRCDCWSKFNDDFESSIRLDDHIENTDGVLHCWL